MLRKLFLVFFFWVFPIFVLQREIILKNDEHEKLNFQGQNFTFLAGLVALFISHGYWKKVFFICLTALLLTLDGMHLYMLIACARQKEKTYHNKMDFKKNNDILMNAFGPEVNCTTEIYYFGKREKGDDVESIYRVVKDLCRVRNGTGPFGCNLKLSKNVSCLENSRFKAKDGIKNLIEKKCPWYLELQYPTISQNCTVAYPLNGYFSELLQNNPNISLMRYEWARFSSFKKFPIESPMSALRLAQNGFHYKGVGDRVVCFSCNIEYENWKIGDSPSLIHKQISPDCGFVTGTDTSNIPIHEDTGPVSEPTYLTQDSLAQSTKSNERVVSDGSLSKENDTASDQQAATRVPEECLGATAAPIETYKGKSNDTKWDTNKSVTVNEQCCFSTNQKVPEIKREPRHPDYADINKRTETFRDWPIEHIIPAKILINSGFVYAGTSDCVRCFHCSIGLRNWEIGDDPCVEHARWSQNCDYLREIKGLPFIQKNSTQIDGVRDEQSTNKPSEVLAKSAIVTNQSKQLNLSNARKEQKEKKPHKTNRRESTHQLNKDTSKTDALEVKEENCKLRSQITCKVCMDRETNTVCLPCGHLVTCEICSKNLRKCAICRTKIQARVKVFMP